ncbi:hypothetical protein [Evansella clarkii]|uniref:hypothetical protein n=1 Tax=Evansella clarkii TaxID=79879 RepID=UPI001431ABED|nr:hypothetical protein [Evansella clarkii]
MKWYNILFLAVFFPIGLFVLMSKLGFWAKIKLLTSSFLALWKGKDAAKEADKSMQTS